MKNSYLFQILYEIANGERRYRIPKARGIAFKIFKFLKESIKKPIFFITVGIGRARILLPIYHQLAWTVNYNKLYSRNLGRINEYITNYIKDYLIVDIGANVGDSAFFIRERDSVNTIICIEGNGEYLPLLRHNSRNLADVQIIESFVGKANDGVTVKLVSDGKGTTTIKNDSNGIVIQCAQLDQLLGHLSVTKRIGLLKIDTDGYDCPIIKDNIDFIKKHLPVLFFEYAPAYFSNGSNEHYDIFRFLLENQYCYFLFYDGAGNYLISSTEKELDLISREMHFYFTSGYKSYGDVVAFQKNDKVLFDDVISQEKKFYNKFYSKE